MWQRVASAFVVLVIGGVAMAFLVYVGSYGFNGAKTLDDFFENVVKSIPVAFGSAVCSVIDRNTTADCAAACGDSHKVVFDLLSEMRREQERGFQLIGNKVDHLNATTERLTQDLDRANAALMDKGLFLMPIPFFMATFSWPWAPVLAEINLCCICWIFGLLHNVLKCTQGVMTVTACSVAAIVIRATTTILFGVETPTATQATVVDGCCSKCLARVGNWVWAGMSKWFCSMWSTQKPVSAVGTGTGVAGTLPRAEETPDTVVQDQPRRVAEDHSTTFEPMAEATLPSYDEAVAPVVRQKKVQVPVPAQAGRHPYMTPEQREQLIALGNSGR